MQNPTVPKIKLTLGSITYPLHFDFEAIAEAEEIVGRPLLTGLRQRDIQSPTINLVRSMLFACLRHDSPNLSFTEVKSFVTRKNLAEVWGKVLEAWTQGMAEPDEDAEANPTEASAN